MGQKRERPFFVRVYRGGVTRNWFTCGLHGGAGQFWGEEKKQKKNRGGNVGERATGRACNGLIWREGSHRGLGTVDKWWTE